MANRIVDTNGNELLLSPSGATDSGNPVKIGAVYNTTAPTLTNGQRGDVQLDSRGNLKATLFGSDTALPTTTGILVDASGGASGLLVYGYSMAYNGATWDRVRTPTVFKTFASTAITAGTGATIWTPAAGKKFRLMGWHISTSAAGQLIFGDNLVATIIARSEAVAAAGVSKAGAADIGNGILSSAANNVLKIDGPTGNVAGMVWGTEE